MTDTTLRLAVDIGGTFTDTVLLDGSGRLLGSSKSLTTHRDPAQGALSGVRRALDAAGRRLAEVSGFVHGATLATNALIERRGATVATVTTEGFRDILEIAYERRYDQYDVDLEKPDFLVPRVRALTVPERMSAFGEPLIALDESAIPGLLDALGRVGAEAVAICLLHAYANPDHELRLRALLKAARPDLEVSISSEVSPEAREFDRLCTTVANAYVQPLMARYLRRFEDAFRAEGLTCPILMMTAGGGMCALDAAAQFPIRLVESGPAGGAILAATIAAENALDAVLSFDMGGTTAKLCLIDGAEPQTSRSFEIARAERFVKGSGMPVRIPVIDMIEIGAGGGSIAAVDRLGRLKVGPKSAGSEPGPVAFQRGGVEPTVTDADVALGYIPVENFAEGQFQIDADAARASLGRAIGAPLGLDSGAAADGVSRIVDESMASAARMHAAEAGKDLSDRTMIAFGGNGPLHACRVARSAGVSRIMIPNDPSVGSALGFLYAPISYESVRSRYSLLQEIDFDAINALLREMSTTAVEIVRRGAPSGALNLRRTAFFRYQGQGHEIEITLPDHVLGEADVGPLTAAFETAYATRYSRPVPGMLIEILNWSVRAGTQTARRSSATAEPLEFDAVGGVDVVVRCDLTDQARAAKLYQRSDLAPGARVVGPALIAEPQTTTFVGADFTARVDARGQLILRRAPMEA